MKGFNRNFKPLEILKEEQVDAIHKGTLEILEKTGVKFEHEKVLKMFEAAGCQVDYNDMRVRMPADIVEECLEKCPSSFHVKARDPKNDLTIGGNILYIDAYPGMRTVDLNTWESREATRSENYDGVKILDALDNFHFFGPYIPYFGFEGILPAMAIPESFAAKMRNSTKFQWEGYQNDSEIFIIQMAKAVGVDIMSDILASPPLTYYRDAIDNALRIAEAGFPLYVGSGLTMGSSGPITIAGSTVTNNAEVIAGIVMIQLAKPGTRVVAGNFSYPADRRTGAPVFGAIEISLHQVIFNQIWRKYGIPSFDTACGATNSKKIDVQCGYEKAFSGILCAVSGANLMHLHGGIYGELTYHPIQSILDDDIAGMIGRFLEGVKVSDETLALDLIHEVGPIPGFYIDKEHTREWWGKEHFMPKSADRLTEPEWKKNGKKSAFDYAKERMEEILFTHKPIPLNPSQEKDVEKILEEARNYYKKRGLI